MPSARASLCQLCTLVVLAGCGVAEEGTAATWQPAPPSRFIADEAPFTAPQPPPEPPPIRPPAPPQQPRPPLELFPDGVPTHALTPPEGWPTQHADAAAVDPGLLRSACHADGRGNWVCLWEPGTGLRAGPCDFAPDGELVVSGQVAWPDYRAQPAGTLPAQWETSAIVVRHSTLGPPVWARAWHRVNGSPPALNVAPWALVVGDAGVTSWAGQDCVPGRTTPAAIDGGYDDSCLDAFVARIGPDGAPADTMRFGTAGGLEFITDMRLTEDGGLYLAGTFHGPLELPGLPAVYTRGGSDFFLARVDPGGQAQWVRSWGGDDVEANGVRIAVSPQGDVATSSNPGLEGPRGDGLVHVFNARGELRWERSQLDLYITHPVLWQDQVITEIGASLARVGPTGAPEPVATPWGLGVSKKRLDTEGNLVLASMTGGAVHVLDPGGAELRSLRFEATDGLWYHGGLCLGPEGEIGISGTVVAPSDFGILDEPLDIRNPAGFVLLLREWG